MGVEQKSGEGIAFRRFRIYPRKQRMMIGGAQVEPAALRNVLGPDRDAISITTCTDQPARADIGADRLRCPSRAEFSNSCNRISWSR